jgi:RHS repeat-associated protein
VETTQPASNGWQRSLSQVSVGVSIPMLKQALKQSNSAQITARTTESNGPAPAASLQYIIYKASDNTFVRNGSVLLQDYGIGDWQALILDITITEEYPVLVDVFANNQDANVAAYFDDLTVQYTPGPVIEENHFYAYGQRNEGLSWQRTDERIYGRGYQGQNTIQDAESGYTAFDLRMYDARYGRWLTFDPERQHFSPYTSFSNNPVNYTDSDGGVDSPIFSSATGNFLGNDSEGFTGDILFMSDNDYNLLRVASPLGVIDHNMAMANSSHVNDTNNLSAVIKALTFVSKLTEGVGSNRLYNGSLSLYEWDMQKSVDVAQNINDGDPDANLNTAALTTHIGSKIKITVGNLSYLYTVENTQNSYVHEYYGHGLLNADGYSTHFKAFDAQMKHSSWKGTTEWWKKNIHTDYTSSMRAAKSLYIKGK